MKVQVEMTGLEDLQKIGNTIAKNVAAKARDELTETFKTSMAEDYYSYVPKRENRRTYEFRDHSFKKYYQNAHGRVAYGGVDVDPSFMAETHYGGSSRNRIPISNADLFDSVMSGWHGFPSVPGVESTSPIPIEVTRKRRDWILANIQSWAADCIAAAL